MSNVMRLYVAPPSANEEAAVAPDYFTEDVGRVIAFGGAPVLAGAQDVFHKVTETCVDNPAAKHAELALTAPMLRNFKVLDTEAGREGLAIKDMDARVSAAAKAQVGALLRDPDAAADTIGHIPYFSQLRTVAEAMEVDGDEKGAIDLYVGDHQRDEKA